MRPLPLVESCRHVFGKGHPAAGEYGSKMDAQCCMHHFRGVVEDVSVFERGEHGAHFAGS